METRRLVEAERRASINMTDRRKLRRPSRAYPRPSSGPYCGKGVRGTVFVMADTNSYRRISAEATLLANVVKRRLYAEGFSDEEVVAFFKVLLSPAQEKPTTAFSSAIGKALQPGVVVKLSDEGVEVTDVRNRRVVHNPEGSTPLDPEAIAKSLFDPKRIGQDYSDEILRRSMHKAREDRLDAADQHDLTQRIRKRATKGQS
jgi:hypothetical protein